MTHEDATALTAAAELLKEVNEEPQCPICGAPLGLEVEHYSGRPCRKLNDAFAKIGESYVRTILGDTLAALMRAGVFSLVCLVAACGGMVHVEGDAGLTDDAAAPSGDGGAVPDASQATTDAGQDAGPQVTRREVCDEIDRLDGELGCMLPKGPDGSVCPPSWAPVCAGPHADWCLNDLQLQVTSCEGLQILIAGECSTACDP